LAVIKSANPDVIRNGIAKPMQGVDKIHCYKIIGADKSVRHGRATAQRLIQILRIVWLCFLRERYSMRDLWEKPWFSVLTKLTYSAYLNILWLICSLPIFTIGASTTALFYCTLKMAEDRDEGLTRMFFRAFRSNFKPATKLWLILLALGCFLGVDGFVLSRLWNTSAFWTILTALVIGAAVLYAIVLLYAFPLLARFENTTLGILRTSFAVGVRYLFCTLLMAHHPRLCRPAGNNDVL